MKGKNFTYSDWVAMNTEIASGLNEAEVIAQRRTGISEENARLYYRARTEGGCITHQDAVKWATAHRPKSGKTSAAADFIDLDKRKSISFFGPDDFRILKDKAALGYDEVRKALRMGLSDSNIREHLQVFNRFNDATYEEHREHYRIVKNGIKKNAPPTQEEVDEQSKAIAKSMEDGELLTSFLKRLSSQSFQDLLYANCVKVEVLVPKVYGYTR
ncbi:MAG: hypothetical protein IJI97_02985 [Clostridia bacterium]|nr:hypothetical protein [Clostridia bacterium]